MRSVLYKIYWAMRRIIAPGLDYSQNEYESVLRQYLQPKAEWLDIGCGRRILPEWRSDAEVDFVAGCKRVVGIDYDEESLQNHCSIDSRLRGDVSSLPFGNNSFDTVTANMVVEHLADPERQFHEVGRVLRPAGLFIFHTPNAAGYFTALTRRVPDSWKDFLIRTLDGRDRGFKTYHKANSEARVSSLAANNGLEVVELRLIPTDAMFACVPPLALIELVYIRILTLERFRRYRTNLIAVLRKRDNGEGPTSATLGTASTNESAGPVKRRRRLGLYRSLLAVGILLLGWFLLAWVAARALVLPSAAGQADAIVVLGGSSTYIERTNLAARLLKAGNAPKIILTNDGQRAGWDKAGERNPLFVEMAAKELQKAGVPSESIDIIWPPAGNTFDEAERLHEYAAISHLRSLMIVTSGYHSRRARWTLSRVFAGSGVSIAIVPVEPGEQAPRAMCWWLYPLGWKLVAGEYGKLIYYRLHY